MALTGNMIDQWNRGNDGVINYDLFVSIFGLLSLLYLIPASIKDSLAIHPLLPLILDILNVIFWFCGAVATAARLGAHSCSNRVRNERIHQIVANSRLISFHRATSSATTSPQALRSAVTRRKPPPPSSSSASSPSLSRPSCLVWELAVAQTQGPASDVARL